MPYMQIQQLEVLNLNQRVQGELQLQSPNSVKNMGFDVAKSKASHDKILEKLNANSTKLQKDNKKLEGCKYEKLLVYNESTKRVNTMLVCKYDNCNRKFKKSWDLLDHVRQHTGEKPYT